ncbi:hypothetical protein CDO46_11315 [Pigmentiphaga sp. NML030171]|nr:hypothetical protein CDO46_11315 [Pigmentiphaga sp. NML030171]
MVGGRARAGRGPGQPGAPGCQAGSAACGIGALTGPGAQAEKERSAVSKRLAELEREHGVALLRRTGRGVEPTAAGEALYRHATSLLSAARQLERTLASHAQHVAPAGR